MTEDRKCRNVDCLNMLPGDPAHHLWGHYCSETCAGRSQQMGWVGLSGRDMQSGNSDAGTWPSPTGSRQVGAQEPNEKQPTD